jgi:hypothetical protein
LAGRAELREVQAVAKVLADHLERQALWVSCFAAHAAHQAAHLGDEEFAPFEAYAASKSVLFSAVLAAASAAKAGVGGTEGNERYAQGEAAERAGQAALLRDVFGNPFQPTPPLGVVFRTGAVLALGKEIYESRSFEQMPALADLLQGAGCDNAEVLEHLRQSGPHVRGCWALDLVLGKGLSC